MGNSASTTKPKMHSLSLLNWPNEPPKWAGEPLALLLKDEIIEPPNLNVNEIIQKSNNFPKNFPIDTVRSIKLQSTVKTEILERNINSAYPLMHENVLFLCSQFLCFKKEHGSSKEKELYKNLSLIQFIQRLLILRAVVFVGRFDYHELIDGTSGYGAWETIGKDNEQEPLTLQKCLSYDEIKLSAFLSVSSYTFFINDGNRRNAGVVTKNRDNIQEEGVIIGLIGSRLVKEDVMEWQEIIISKTQNTKSNGYGTQTNLTLPQLFTNFYGEPSLTYKDLLKMVDNNTARFKKIDDKYFDNILYSKRISISIDTLLIEANHRAKEQNTFAYIHVVGLGLGVWMISPHQEEVFVESFGKRLQYLGTNLHHVSAVHFAHFKRTQSCLNHSDKALFKIDGHPKGGIKVYISNRQPHIKLSGEHQNDLLIVSYAWDGNALPGNEFWVNNLATSSDPAAACSTQVSELHNPHINSKVCGDNLKIATSNGIISFREYREKHCK